jgi:DNA-binding winged helix-turn-helix (wHTH) protein/tetratricopeptide (TPR) repeat protein
MASPAHTSPAFRFGPFVLFVAAGELRKGETLLKLHPQPFRILVMLAERAGALVTREEIQRALWGGHTWVDFDAGINFCIRQIRAVLADDAEKPRYIETIARKGYRFISPVTHADFPAVVVPISRAASPLATVPPLADIAETPPAVPGTSLSPGPPAPAVVAAPTRRPYRLVLLAATLGAVLAASFVAVYLVTHRTPKLTQKDTVVVADFRNTTGDPVFDGTLQQGLSAQLEQSPFLNLVSDPQIQQTLRMMKQPPDAKLTGELATEICQRTNGAAVLTGSIAQIGAQYDLILKAASCSTGESLATTEAQASDKNHVLRALGEASSALREKLGESLATVQKFDTPLVQATTPSLEALKAYTLGFSNYSRGDQSGAIPFFQQAIQVDPDFAIAYANLGRSYQVLGKREQMAAALRQAYALRDRASERERFDIVAVYHQFVTTRLDESIKNCELWEQSYPRDFTPHRMLGYEYGVLGRYDQSAQEFSKAVKLDPGQALPYAGLLIDLTALQRFPEAHAVFAKAKEHHVDGGEVQRNFYMTAFIEGDQHLIAELAASLSAQPGYASKLLLEESSAASYFGRYAEARELFARTKDTALHDKNTDTAAYLESYMGIREALVGNSALARDHAVAARQLGETSLLALILAGDTAEASKAVERLASQTLPGSYDDLVTLPELKGAVALQRGDATAALEFFQPLVPYESGWSDRYTAAYLRGQAFLLARRGQGAGGEFQKILKHPGIVLNSELAPLAHVGLARAYAITGDTSKARVAYQDFFTLWKDADPDIPILKQAQAEYAKLQ